MESAPVEELAALLPECKAVDERIAAADSISVYFRAMSETGCRMDLRHQAGRIASREAPAGIFCGASIPGAKCEPEAVLKPVRSA
jgi:hypothetical protein